MKRFVFYHPETGVLHGQTLMLDVNDLENSLKLNTPDGHVAHEHDTAWPGHHRFDLVSKQIVEDIPPAPSPDHEWNPGRHRWTLKPEMVEVTQARSRQTNALLEEQRKVVVGYLLGRGGMDRIREIEDELKNLQGPQGVTPSG